MQAPEQAQCRLTYAQNTCCGAPKHACKGKCCYETNSESKLLIYKDLNLCFFDGHFVETLDFQGLAAGDDKLSTKLSTEILNHLQSLSRSST
jgi:hypothetical protein